MKRNVVFYDSIRGTNCDRSRDGKSILSARATNQNTGFLSFGLPVEPAIKKRNIVYIRMQKKLLPLDV